MHVLYICHEYPPAKAGGIGPAVATLARGMVRAGHRVSVLGFYPDASVDDDQGVTVHRLAWPRRRPFVNWYLNRLQLRRKIIEIHRSEKIDLVEWPDYQGWFWKPVPGIVDVVKVHGTLMSHRIHGLAERHRFYEWLELRTLRKIKNWVGVSKWFNEEWKQIAGVTPAREAIVYNPVNTELFVPRDAPHEPGLVVYAGGLKRRKGVFALAQAAGIFLKSVPASRLVMIGFESDITEQDIRRAAGESADKIEFIPFMHQRDLAAYFARASVYAMPSLYESCGNTWLEAMSCQTPAIGSLLSCGPEIVSDGRTGLLANPENPQDVADKITKLLTNPDLAAQMGQAGRQWVLERFSLDVAVGISENFYRQCIADAANRRANA